MPKVRTAMFVCMMVNSGTLLLIRSISAACMLSVSGSYFAIYTAIDLGVFVLWKVVRRDFRYWIPIRGVIGWTVSSTLLICVKLITDYSGMIHMRNAPEMGGLFWTFDMCMSMAASFVMIMIYYGEVDLGDVAVSEGSAWLGVSVMASVWFFCFGLFLYMMNPQ